MCIRDRPAAQAWPPRPDIVPACQNPLTLFGLVLFPQRKNQFNLPPAQAGPADNFVMPTSLLPERNGLLPLPAGGTRSSGAGLSKPPPGRNGKSFFQETAALLQVIDAPGLSSQVRVPARIKLLLQELPEHHSGIVPVKPEPACGRSQQKTDNKIKQACLLYTSRCV